MPALAEAASLPSPRSVCPACRRPSSVCYCEHLTTIETKTRVVFLQHPRERDVAIGTARMASLCLPNSELHVGVDWRGSAALQRALSDPHRTPVLLYPGGGAFDVLSDPWPTKDARPLTLVVVDGTWWQAKKIVRQNPELAALPRYAFTPPKPSEYRIRKEPSDDCVSTIEALVHVLGAIEGDKARFAALLVPFRAMVDTQLACEMRYQGARVRHPRRKPEAAAAPPVPPSVRERAADLVCVAGEANAWPYGSPERDAGYADELVHWVALRVETGEAFDMVIAPRHPLSPATSAHTGLSPRALAEGGRVADFHDRWRAFVRETDVACSWGSHATALFEATGAALPKGRLDVRAAARLFARGKAGTPFEFGTRVGALSHASEGKGRALSRLHQLVAIVRHFRGDP